MLLKIVEAGTTNLNDVGKNACMFSVWSGNTEDCKEFVGDFSPNDLLLYLFLFANTISRNNEICIANVLKGRYVIFYGTL